MQVKKLRYEEIKNYKSMVEKESVDLKKNWTIYYWWFVDWELVWFVWVMLVWNNIRYKSDYVFKEHRWKWYYDTLFDVRDKIVQWAVKKWTKITAFCTNKSIWTFLRKWFVIENKNKNWIYFVKKIVWKATKVGQQKKEEKA